MLMPRLESGSLRTATILSGPHRLASRMAEAWWSWCCVTVMLSAAGGAHTHTSGTGEMELRRRSWGRAGLSTYKTNACLSKKLLENMGILLKLQAYTNFSDYFCYLFI